MKFVGVIGGLGNQMFDYALKVRLSKENKVCLFRPYMKKSDKYGHTGYQLESVFSLRADDRQKQLGGELVFVVFWRIKALLPKIVAQALLKLMGVRIVKVPLNFVFYPEVLRPNLRNEIYMGTWQSEKYFRGVEQEVRQAFTFRETLLNDKTRLLWGKLDQCESISLHVRRDDYLLPQYAQGFGGICTIAYYKAAVEYLKERIARPVFFVFSDDIAWCQTNLGMQDATFVDWNRGNESWQDMFLMSKCRHNIIANSTFSWWGAWLNDNPDKIVIAPDKWWNGIIDDVVPDGWIRLSGAEKA